MPLSLDALLSEARSSLDRSVPIPKPSSNCLTFGELRHLALGTGRAATGVVEHLRHCQRCSRRAASCAECLPHLPWWILLRSGVNQLSAEEERAAQYHLEEGKCAECMARRYRLLEGEQKPTAFSFFAPGAAALAASRTSNLVVSTHGGAYEVDLLATSPRLECEIRTQDLSLLNRLFAYTCYGDHSDSPAYVGYTVLENDLNGWYSGQISVDNPPFPQTRSFSGTYLLAMHPEELISEEIDPLLTSIGYTLADPLIRRRWQGWLERVPATFTDHTPSEPMRRLLSELKLRLY